MFGVKPSSSPSLKYCLKIGFTFINIYVLFVNIGEYRFNHVCEVIA